MTADPRAYAMWVAVGAQDPAAGLLPGVASAEVAARLDAIAATARDRVASRAQGRSGHPPCIVDPHDDGSPVDADYQPTTMHRAVCADCKPILPRAFDTTADRDLWVFAHIEHTEHRVFLAPDPTPTSTADEALAAVERAHEALAALVVSLHNPNHPSKETP